MSTHKNRRTPTLPCKTLRPNLTQRHSRQDTPLTVAHAAYERFKSKSPCPLSHTPNQGSSQSNGPGAPITTRCVVSPHDTAHLQIHARADTAHTANNSRSKEFQELRVHPHGGKKRGRGAQRHIHRKQRRNMGKISARTRDRLSRDNED